MPATRFVKHEPRMNGYDGLSNRQQENIPLSDALLWVIDASRRHAFDCTCALPDTSAFEFDIPKTRRLGHLPC